MTDTPETPHTPLPDFVPVPRKCARHDGWTPERQKAFIEALADYGSVRDACRVVGLATTGAYQLRRQPGAEEFAAAWEAALACTINRLEDTLLDRALNGVEVPVYSYGKLLGTRTVHNDRLGMFFLRNRAPHRFAAGGGAKALNAIDKAKLARLKEEWRREWLAEEAEQDKEAEAGLERWLDDMATNRRTNMSPAQRAHEIASHAQARADREAGWHAGMPYRPYAAAAAELLPRFIAEAEAEWPPLPDGAWDDPEEEQQPAPQPPALPPPAEAKPEEPDKPSGPRIRRITDDGW